MKTVFVDSDISRLGHAKSILESEGILCLVRNELSHGYMGTTIIGPLKIFDPELNVMNDEDYPRAIELLQEWLHPTTIPQSDWKCPACGEMVPGSMGECWACQAEAPAA